MKYLMQELYLLDGSNKFFALFFMFLLIICVIMVIALTIVKKLKD